MSKICVLGLGGNSVFLSVDHFHGEGETVSAHKLFTEPGGKGYNQAVAAARLGGEVSFIGAFGKDGPSAECISYLNNEGITPLIAYKEEPCAYACILTDKFGSNRVTVYRGATDLLTAEDIAAFEERIRNGAVLVLQNEVPAEANRAAARIAKKHGVTILVNPAPAVGMDAEVLSMADIVTPNEHEAVYLYGTDYRKGISDSGIRLAAVTLGADGADVYCDGKWTRMPPYKVEAEDTTGAGDCFTGALACWIAGGGAFIEGCDFAMHAAALAVSKPHAVEAMPYSREIFNKK